MKWLDGSLDLARDLKSALHEEISSWISLLRQIWLPLLALLVGLLVMLSLAKPAPPSMVRLAVGHPPDYSHTIAQRYAAFFKDKGIELELVETEGSLASLDRVRNDEDPIQAAMVEGGLMAAPSDAARLRSLGSIGYQPVWLFYWGPLESDDETTIRSLLKKRISIGNIGSGTHQKALDILKLNGLKAGPNFLTLDQAEAAEALQEHHIDALLMVEDVGSPLIQELLQNPNLRVAHFARAQAYAKQLPYLEVLAGPMGSFSLMRNHPDRDIELMAATTNIVVHEDLHPAIQMLFMEASSHIAGQEGFFSKPKEFPDYKDPTYPESEVAHRFFESGPPMLNLYLPFWIAEFIQRMALLLIPFVAFAYPIIKAIPSFLKERAQKRIHRYYGELRRIEDELESPLEEALIEAVLERLDRMEHDLKKSRISRKEVIAFYALRNDMDFVRNILERHRCRNRS